MLKRLCLANIDYRTHMTDEGEQLQAGLHLAGWTLAGHGYGDGCTNVPELLERHRPDVVFVQDKRDWDPCNAGGCFNRKVAFHDAAALAGRGDLFTVGVCKDAGTLVEYQRSAAFEIAADAIVTYYHDASVLALSPWLADFRRIRTYHSIDADVCRAIDPARAGRNRGLVSGAANPRVYPLRSAAIAHAAWLGLECLPHPGYGNRGCDTRRYLATLARFRVHVATASAYGFALRKIIESVAVGCTPVTDLPACDVLPEIDAALVRVPAGCSLRELRAAIDDADRNWNPRRARYFAEAARQFYDYRAIGRRLDAAIADAACGARARTAHV